ncbi:MAG: nucleotide exchange factor GrpE [Oscillospiraceae bacterium]|nr:nucleotide exchange factor GrpE [Oscillospiraceae bacterium]
MDKNEHEMQCDEALHEGPGEALCGEDETPEPLPVPLQQEYDELNNRYLRLMAEYDNFRKRSQKEKDEIYPAATAAALQKLLPVLDALERADKFERGTDEFAKGFDMILQSFKDVLTALGVEESGAVGEEFDPNIHNAAMHIEDENLGQNVVSQVFQKGYRLGGKVIRYAMVQTAN